MDNIKKETPSEINNINEDEDHQHKYIPFPDNSAVFCNICGIQDLNLDIAKLSVQNDSEEKLILTSLIPLVQKIRSLSASSIYNENHNVENSLLKSIPKKGFLVLGALK